MGSATALTFPMSVGAAAVLLPDRPTPDAVLDTMQRASADDVRRRADAVRRDAGQSAHRARRRFATGCAAASPPARRCPPISAGAGATWSAWTSSTASAPPRCCTSSYRNRPDDIRYGTSRQAGAGLRGADPGRARPAACRNGEAGRTGGARTVSAADGYWNQRDKTRRTFRGEWTHTGDTYIRDADGYFRFCGRTDEMLKVSGVWVSPFEVEEALISHPAVLESAVIGAQDGDGLTKPKAFVVLQDAARAAGRRDGEGTAEDAREGADRRVEISALDRVRGRPAEDRDRQDPALPAAR